MKGSGNLDESVQGKLQFAALREPLLFPCLVSFKEPLPVKKVGAARNSGTHTEFIVARDAATRGNELWRKQYESLA